MHTVPTLRRVKPNKKEPENDESYNTLPTWLSVQKYLLDYFIIIIFLMLLDGVYICILVLVHPALNKRN